MFSGSTQFANVFAEFLSLDAIRYKNFRDMKTHPYYVSYMLTTVSEF